MLSRTLSRFAPKHFLVGVAMKDVVGSQNAMKAALELAKGGDKVTAIHVPGTIPQVMLSSVSDPTITSAEGANLFSPEFFKEKAEEASHACLASVKGVVQEAARSDVQVAYKVGAPSNDIKCDLVSAAKSMGVDYVVVGPGRNCDGRLADWLLGNLYNCSLIAVRGGCAK